MPSEQMNFAFDGDLGRRPPKAAKRNQRSSPDNLFMGLQPPESVWREVETIAELIKARHGIVARLRPFHITLHDLLGQKEDVSEALILDAIDVLETLCFEPFPVVLDRVKSLWLGNEWAIALVGKQHNEPLFDLQARLVNARQRPGIEANLKQPFNPHLALFYSRKRIETQDIEHEVTWTACEPSLIHSIWGETRHERRWPRTMPDEFAEGGIAL